MVPTGPIAKLTRIVSVLGGVTLLTLAAGDPQPLSHTSGAAAAAAASAVPTATQASARVEDLDAGVSHYVFLADLYRCPTLSRGSRDPINGLNCVRALQGALRDHGGLLKTLQHKLLRISI